MRYYQGKEKTRWTNAAMAIIVIDPITGEKSVIPAYWPQTQEDKALNNFKEIHARAKVGDVRGYLDKTPAKIHSLLRKYAMSRKPFFEHFDWTDKGMNMVDTSKCPKEGPTGWGRLQANGYWGMQLRKEDVLQPNGQPVEIFNEWPEFVALLNEQFASIAAISKM